MKKSILFSLLLFMSITVFSQVNSNHELKKSLISEFDRHELKLNLPMTIFGSYPEITYEYLLNEDFSIGATAGFSLKSEANTYIKYAVMPYARWFFGGSYTSLQKYAAGFFLEANAAIFDGEANYTWIGDDNAFEVGAGLGIAFGWKYVSLNNWIGEVYFGMGRDFIGEDRLYPRVGISIGKRF